jgi:hypothetical protein
MMKKSRSDAQKVANAVRFSASSNCISLMTTASSGAFNSSTGLLMVQRI